MQISRSIRLACLTAAVIFPLALPAQDDATQAKLRQALDKKLNEMQPAPAAPATAPAASVPAPPKPAAPAAAAKPAKSKAAAPVAQTPAAKPVAPAAAAAPKPAAVVPAAVAATPKPAATTVAPAEPVEDAAKAKALEEALRNAMIEAPSATANGPAAQPAVVAAPAAAAISQPVAASTPEAPKSQGEFKEFNVTPAVPAAAVSAAAVAGSEPQPVMESSPEQPGAKYEEFVMPPPTQAEADEKAREAMREKMLNLKTQQMAVQVREEGGANIKPSKNSLNLPPITPPPLGISAAKEDRLQALLQQYRSDMITPEKYHTERARILSEP